MTRKYNFLRNLLIKQIFDDVNLMAAKLDIYFDHTLLLTQLDKYMRLNEITSYEVEDNKEYILVLIKYRDENPIEIVVDKLNASSYHDALILKNIKMYKQNLKKCKN